MLDPGPRTLHLGPGPETLYVWPFYIETSPLICLDWFLYDGDLRHERVNQLHVFDQVRGVIRALQTSMMVL